MTWPVTSQSNSMRMAARCCLDRGRREMALQILNEGGDVEGLYVGELVQAVQLAPLGKAARRVQVGFPGVVVVDLRSEEFERALRRLRRRREQRSGKHGGGRGEGDVHAGAHELSGFHKRPAVLYGLCGSNCPGSRILAQRRYESFRAIWRGAAAAFQSGPEGCEENGVVRPNPRKFRQAVCHNISGSNRIESTI